MRPPALRGTELAARPKPFGASIFDNRIVINYGAHPPILDVAQGTPKLLKIAPLPLRCLGVAHESVMADGAKHIGRNGGGAILRPSELNQQAIMGRERGRGSRPMPRPPSLKLRWASQINPPSLKLRRATKKGKRK